MTTRATPASASCWASASVRTPPPVCTIARPPPQRRWLPRRGDSPASRTERHRGRRRGSTMRLHRQTSVATAIGITAVHDGAAVVALCQTARPDRRADRWPGRGRSSVRPRSPRRDAHEVAEHRHAPRTRLLGMELGGEDVVLAKRSIDDAAVGTGRRHGCRIVGNTVQASGRSTPTPAADRPANIGSSGSARVSRFHCICGRGSSDPSQRIVPGMMPSPTAESSSSLPSNSICIPTQIPRNGRPESTASSTASSRSASRSAAMHASERTDTRKHHRVGVVDQTVIDGETSIGTATLQRLLGRPQVADSIVEHGNQRLVAHRFTARPSSTESGRPRPARRREGIVPDP